MMEIIQYLFTGDFCTLEILLEDSFSWLKVLFFRVFPFSLVFGYIYLIVALVPVVCGFSVHLLEGMSLSTLIWLCHI